MILEPVASSGSEYRNAAYGDERRGASTSAATVQARLVAIGADEVEHRFMETLDLLTNTLETAEAKWSEWTVTQQNPRGVPRHFHVLFVAVSKLITAENLTPKSNGQLAGALKGFWDRDLTIPGGGNWGGERKAGLLDAVKGLLSPHFEPTRDENKDTSKRASLTF